VDTNKTSFSCHTFLVSCMSCVIFPENWKFRFVNQSGCICFLVNIMSGFLCIVLSHFCWFKTVVPNAEGTVSAYLHERTKENECQDSQIWGKHFLNTKQELCSMFNRNQRNIMQIISANFSDMPANLLCKNGSILQQTGSLIISTMCKILLQCMVQGKALLSCSVVFMADSKS
jgi:hypothetical protein